MIYKYPRTPHLLGSALQPGDEDVPVLPLAELTGRQVVVEEKLDGANSGISFDAGGRLRLQSRGHELTGGPRERQFDLFKSWAQRYRTELWQALHDRYVLYGEWLYAKHTIFYNHLPHYFVEFDIFDTLTEKFLDTARRQAQLEPAPFIVSAPVLYAGAAPARVERLMGPSPAITAHRHEALRARCAEAGLDLAMVARETDLSGLMEGLYVKVEEGGAVVARYKYVRPGFRQAVADAGSHWMDRPLLSNCLRPGVELF